MTEYNDTFGILKKIFRTYCYIPSRIWALHGNILVETRRLWSSSIFGTWHWRSFSSRWHRDTNRQGQTSTDQILEVFVFFEEPWRQSEVSASWSVRSRPLPPPKKRTAGSVSVPEAFAAVAYSERGKGHSGSSLARTTNSLIQFHNRWTQNSSVYESDARTP